MDSILQEGIAETVSDHLDSYNKCADRIYLIIKLNLVFDPISHVSISTEPEEKWQSDCDAHLKRQQQVYPLTSDSRKCVFHFES